MLVVLLGLGTWQLQRLAWKNALLADIAAAQIRPPEPLGAGRPADFHRVIATGVLRAGRPALYGTELRDDTPPGHLGAYQIRVLDRPSPSGAAPLPPLLVDLGWVPADGPPPGALPATPIAITGYIRRAEPSGLLSAPDDPDTLRFYALDPAVIGPALGARDVLPFTLVALGGPAAAPAPDPARALPVPVNNHLQYALTWFGLAAVLLVVFGVWVRNAVLARRVAAELGVHR